VDSRSGRSVRDVMTTVVAAEQLTAANHYRVKTTIPLPWHEPRSMFLNVPPGTTMLRLDLAVERGRYKLSLFGPTLDAGYVPSVDPTDFLTYISAGHAGVRLVPNPEPGVWEVVLQPTWDMVNLGDLASAPHHISRQATLTASVSLNPVIDAALTGPRADQGAGIPETVAV